nr:hypothetical protein [Pseudomonas amygdali]
MPQALADWVGIGGFGRCLSAAMKPWPICCRRVEETDVDGFNLAYALTHETFIDAVDLLVPELQKRGVYKTNTPKAPCARNCSAKDHAWKQGTRALPFATSLQCIALAKRRVPEV